MLDARIADPEDKEVPRGAIGEMQIRGPSIISEERFGIIQVGVSKISVIDWGKEITVFNILPVDGGKQHSIAAQVLSHARRYPALFDPSQPSTMLSVGTFANLTRPVPTLRS